MLDYQANNAPQGSPDKCLGCQASELPRCKIKKTMCMYASFYHDKSE